MFEFYTIVIKHDVCDIFLDVQRQPPFSKVPPMVMALAVPYNPPMLQLGPRHTPRIFLIKHIGPEVGLLWDD